MYVCNINVDLNVLYFTIHLILNINMYVCTQYIVQFFTFLNSCCRALEKTNHLITKRQPVGNVGKSLEVGGNGLSIINLFMVMST